MENEIFCDDYYVSDPGDEQGSVFDYFNNHPSSAKVHGEYVDETDEEWVKPKPLLALHQQVFRRGF